MPPITTQEVSTLHEYLLETLSHLAEKDCIHQVGTSVLAIIRVRPSAVRALAHKKLHVYPFEDVPLCWRRAFEEACLWEIVDVLNCAPAASSDVQDSKQAALNDAGNVWITKTVALCDTAIIFTGAPQRRGLIDNILDVFDDQVWPVYKDRLVSPKDADWRDDHDHQPTKKRRFTAKPKYSLDSFPADGIGGPTPLLNDEVSISRVEAPTLSSFSKHMRVQRSPMIITRSIGHWPAIDRWQNPSYWLSRTHGGQRLVPVELGKSYTDEGWGQQIMEFGEYLHAYVLQPSLEKKVSTRPMAIGYLAQYDLLAQIPALRNDIAVPDYCFVDTPKQSTPNEQSKLRSKQQGPPTPPALGPDLTPRTQPDQIVDTVTRELSPASSPSDDGRDEPMEPAINLWLGPAGTISPAHHDPHENILAQVVGRKYIRLFAPDQGPRMYPMGTQKGNVEFNHSDDTCSDSYQLVSDNDGVDMHNTSQVDVGAFLEWAHPEAFATKERADQATHFPQHAQAQYFECILEAGECLYIPRGWWHYVRSLTPSCSVSFWWD